MPKIDLTVTISVLITLCALASPIVTAFINNRHLEHMKKLEYEHEERVSREAHNREVLEGYIRAAGACIQSQSTEIRADFGEHSALAAYYVPDEIRENILLLEKTISKRDAGSLELLATITNQLRNTQAETLCTPHR